METTKAHLAPPAGQHQLMMMTTTTIMMMAMTVMMTTMVITTATAMRYRMAMPNYWKKSLCIPILDQCIGSDGAINEARLERNVREINQRATHVLWSVSLSNALH